MLENLRATSPEDFAHQLQEYSGITQAMLGFTLLPPSLESEIGRLELAAMENPVLEKQYKKRMEILSSLHEAQMSGIPIDDNERKKCKQLFKY